MKNTSSLEAEPFETYTEFDEVSELLDESQLVSHPRLGWGRSVSRQREAEEIGRSGLISHPRLGYGRSVRRTPAVGELDTGEVEIVGPTDDRILSTNTLQVPFRWICCLDLYFPDPDNLTKDMLFRGSGTLVSPRHVLTAGHCLWDEVEGSKGTKAKLEVRAIKVTPGRNGVDASGKPRQPLGSNESVAVRYSRNWESSLSPEFDYGLITLKNSIGTTLQPALGNRPLGFWGSKEWGAGTRINPRDPNVLLNKPVNISGYPADKCGDQPPKWSASDAALAACPVNKWGSNQWRAYGRVKGVSPSPSRLIYHDLDTKGGHSGSPVWLRWQDFRNLIAIHTGWEVFGVSNRAVRITADVWRDVQSWMR